MCAIVLAKGSLSAHQTQMYTTLACRLSNHPMQDVYVQLSPLSSPELRLLHLNSLYSDLAGDPDLALIPEEIRPKLLQSVFICTGCDYISFFSGIGKAAFLRIFFQHSSFVNANSADFPGHLANMEPNDLHSGFKAFVRLVGTAYFKKYLSAFKQDSPHALMNSCQQSSPEEAHKHHPRHSVGTC